jgi:ATP-dependent Clp protease ATP-binding subunit ClpA
MALKLAAEERETFSNKYIENEHLLLGILRLSDSYSARLLVRRGLSVDLLRAQVATLERLQLSAAKPKPPNSSEQRFMLDTIKRTRELSPKKALKFLDGLISDPKQVAGMRKFLLPLASAKARSLNDFATVKRYSELALRDDADDAMALYALADSLDELGDTDAAKKCAVRCYECALAMEDALRSAIIELLEKRFPGITPTGA